MEPHCGGYSSCFRDKPAICSGNHWRMLFLKHSSVWLHGPPTLIHGCEGSSLQSVHRIREWSDLALWPHRHVTVERHAQHSEPLPFPISYRLWNYCSEHCASFYTSYLDPSYENVSRLENWDSDKRVAWWQHWNGSVIRSAPSTFSYNTFAILLLNTLVLLQGLVAVVSEWGCST